MRKFGTFAAALGLVGLATAVGPAVAQETVTWRFGHVFSVPNTLFDDVAMKELPDKIREASDGMVNIEVVTGIVGPNDMFDALADGRIQMGSLVTAAVSASYPRWHVLGVPGVLDSESDFPDVATNVVWPAIEKETMERWRGRLVTMGAFSGTFFFSQESNGPVDSIADFQGLKYRTHSLEVSQLIQAVGGAPVGLPFGELYGAMQRNTVDAYTSATPAVLGTGLFEVTKYAEDWPAGLGLWFYLVSEDALDKLPADVREAVLKAFAEVQSDMPQRQLAETAESIETLKGKGMEFVTVPEAEKAKLREVAEDVVWTDWVKRTEPGGEALLDDVLKALGKR